MTSIGDANLYANLSAAKLSAILLKDVVMSSILERDAGFCSGSSENGDDIMLESSREGPRSPTDASEDSVEVKVMPITLPRNKRKSSEPLRVVSESDLCGPIKKRIRYSEDEIKVQEIQKSKNETTNTSCSNSEELQNVDLQSHFRPWAPPSTINEADEHLHLSPNPAEVYKRHPGVTTLHRVLCCSPIQDQPLALVAKKSPINQLGDHKTANQTSNENNSIYSYHEQNTTLPADYPSTMYSVSSSSLSSSSRSDLAKVKSEPDRTVTPIEIDINGGSNLSMSQLQQQAQRNYKNMTRERRIEANARERTRVHTISAAFDTLRHSVPSYSNSQKLSKLSVLRIACSYILTLSRLAGLDYSKNESEPSLAECVELVTRTIQTEGKLRKKKDD